MENKPKPESEQYAQEHRRKGPKSSVARSAPKRLVLGDVSDVQHVSDASLGKPGRSDISGVPPVNWRGFSQVFAMTQPAPCPYLPDLMERKLVTALGGGSSKMSALNWAGFRRSHSLAYRPACQSCNKCQALRILTKDVVASKSQKRLLSKADGIERRLARTVATAEHYSLFEDYVVTRHGDGEMAQMTMSDFRAMLEETPVSSMLVEWRDEGKLIAACLVDITVDGLSMVYSYFHPAYKVQGLGTFMILDLIQFSREKDLPYLYLGYWVEGSPKMDYKAKFQPQEVYGVEGWVSKKPS